MATWPGNLYFRAISVIVSMVLNNEMKRQLQEIIGKAMPNGVVINHVLGWLDAADDNLARDDLIRLMKRSYTGEEIVEAKEILKDLVKQNHEIYKTDKSIDKLMTGKREPEKKDKDAADVVDLMCKLNDQGKLPTILIVSTDMVRNPMLQNVDDNVEHVSHKVKMLETCIVNLVDKVNLHHKDLKEEIKSIKPTYAELFKQRENVAPKGQGATMRDQIRERYRSAKRSRGDDGPIDRAHDQTDTEVFNEDNDGFGQQKSRGFMNRERQTHHDQNQRRGSGSNWRSRLPNVSGEGSDRQFAAPVDLFVYNVNKDVTKEAIVDHMKNTKGLDLLECDKVSHDEARNQSFKVKVKSADYDKAMSAETWPYRVRVRVYRHFRQRRQEESSQSGQFESPATATVRQPESSHGFPANGQMRQPAQPGHGQNSNQC